MTVGFARVAELDAVNADLRGNPAQRRLSQRRAHSAPPGNAFRRWLPDQRAHVFRKSRPGDKLAYIPRHGNGLKPSSTMVASSWTQTASRRSVVTEPLLPRTKAAFAKQRRRPLEHCQNSQNLVFDLMTDLEMWLPSRSNKRLLLNDFG